MILYSISYIRTYHIWYRISYIPYNVIYDVWISLCSPLPGLHSGLDSFCFNTSTMVQLTMAAFYVSISASLLLWSVPLYCSREALIEAGNETILSQTTAWIIKWDWNLHWQFQRRKSSQSMSTWFFDANCPLKKNIIRLVVRRQKDRRILMIEINFQSAPDLLGPWDTEIHIWHLISHVILHM